MHHHEKKKMSGKETKDGDPRCATDLYTQKKKTSALKVCDPILFLDPFNKRSPVTGEDVSFALHTVNSTFTDLSTALYMFLDRLAPFCAIVLSQ